MKDEREVRVEPVSTVKVVALKVKGYVFPSNTKEEIVLF